MKTTTSSSTSAPTTTASSRSGRRPQQQSPRQGLPSRPDHQLQHTEPESEAAALPPIDLGKRRLHRGFGTSQLLALLQSKAPEFFERAEVVGKWVWIEFADKQPREITAQLAEFGFHWNNKRGVWQHPCGQVTPGTESDPKQKYQAYFPAQVRA
ncbi:hypothetical protein GC207_13340 [bacterium]|nr:hypothetical protein [bacterium]